MIIKMRTIFQLTIFFLLFSPKVFSQTILNTVAPIDIAPVASGAEGFYEGSVQYTTGLSFNLKADCATSCSGMVIVQASNDKVTYEDIPQVTQVFTGASTNFLFNIFNIRFLYFRIVIRNTGGETITPVGTFSVKTQI